MARLVWSSLGFHPDLVLKFWIFIIVRLEHISIANLGDDLEKRWSALLLQSDAFGSPFYSPAFAKVVGRHHENLRIGLIETAGAVTGILPFHRCAGGRGAPVGGHACDYQGIIGTLPAPSLSGELLRGFGLAAYDFDHALADQALFAQQAFKVGNSPRADLRQGYDNWCADVAGKTNALKTLARKERKLARHIGPLTFKFHDTSPKAWPTFVHWKAEALKHFGVHFLADTKDARLLEDLRDEQGPELQGRLSTLYAGDRLVAAHFGIATPRAWHWWFPSYDPQMGNLSVGLILMRHCIQTAADEGIGELDFGRGNERYKVEFSNQSRALCEGSLERPIHPIGALRWLRKAVQKQGNRLLPAQQADLLHRAGKKLLKAGRL